MKTETNLPERPTFDVKTVWRKCGHPRTLENSVGNQFRYGCRKCAQHNKREYYYRGRGYDAPPLPVAYRNALRGSVRRWTNVGQTYIRERVRETCDAAEPLTRACYLLIAYHRKPVQEIAYWLKLDAEEVQRRHDEIDAELRLTALTDRQFKNWPMIQEMLDAGVEEADMKEMLGISQAGWDRAKRLGKIRVQR